MSKRLQIDQVRDKQIVFAYQKKNAAGEYEYSMIDMQSIFEISSARIYMILQRNGVETRGGKKPVGTFYTDMNLMLEATTEAILAGKNVRTVRQSNGWEVSIT